MGDAALRRPARDCSAQKMAPVAQLIVSSGSSATARWPRRWLVSPWIVRHQVTLRAFRPRSIGRSTASQSDAGRADADLAQPGREQVGGRLETGGGSADSILQGQPKRPLVAEIQPSEGHRQLVLRRVLERPRPATGTPTNECSRATFSARGWPSTEAESQSRTKIAGRLPPLQRTLVDDMSP